MKPLDCYYQWVAYPLKLRCTAHNTEVSEDDLGDEYGDSVVGLDLISALNYACAKKTNPKCGRKQYAV